MRLDGYRARQNSVGLSAHCANSFILHMSMCCDCPSEHGQMRENVGLLNCRITEVSLYQTDTILSEIFRQYGTYLVLEITVGIDTICLPYLREQSTKRECESNSEKPETNL